MNKTIKTILITFSITTLVLFILVRFTLRVMFDEGNYIDKDIHIIGQKISGVWVEEENRKDTVLFFIDIKEDRDELYGIMTYDFELIDSGFRTPKDNISIAIRRNNEKVFFSINTYSFFGETEDYEIEKINNTTLKLVDYKEYLRVDGLYERERMN